MGCKFALKVMLHDMQQRRQADVPGQAPPRTGGRSALPVRSLKRRVPNGPGACPYPAAPAFWPAAWSCRTWSMAAMMTRADPSMAWATGLDGWLSWLAIWAADRPASTCGLYCAPARMYWSAMSRNGTAPDWSALLT